MAESARKEVVFALTTELSQNATKAIDELIARVKGAQAEMSKGFKSAAEEFAKASKQQGGGQQTEAKARATWEQEQYQRSMELNKRATRDQTTEAKKASDAIKQAMLDRAKAHKATIDAQIEGEKKGQAAFTRSIELTRGLALMLSTTQAGSEKLITSLMRIEGAAGMLRGMGLGGLMQLAGPIGAIIGGTISGFQVGTLGPRLQEQRTAERTSILGGTIQAGRNAREAALGQHQQVAGMTYQQQMAGQQLRYDLADIGTESSRRWQTARQPILGKMSWNWSAEMNPYRPGRDPGAAGYNMLEGAMGIDRARGAGIIGGLQGKAGIADQELAQRKAELDRARAEATRTREASAIASTHSARAQQRLAEWQQWGPNANEGWLESANRMNVRFRGWLRGGIRTKQFDAEARSRGYNATKSGYDSRQLGYEAREAGLGAGAEAKTASDAEARVQQAEKVTTDALNRQKDIQHEIAQEKQQQAQRDIQYSEEYLGKLKEMYQAHMANANALERSGQAMTAQLAVDPSSRARLFAAMERAKTGTATDRQLNLLAQSASPERSKAFLDQIQARHPEYEGLKDFLGKGVTAVDDQRARATEEAQRIRETEQHIQGVKDAAAQAADAMSNQLANVLRQLFATQTETFVRRIELLKQEIEQQGVQNVGATQ